MRWFLGFIVLFGAFVIAPAAPAFAFPSGPWTRPVDGPVVRGFDPPTTRFGPGHLGVDFGVRSGTPVRAANDGTVVFAGRVGAGLHVVVLNAGDVRTTDSFLASIAVVRGQHVARGETVGTTGGTGPQHAADVLHFGVRVGDDYIDPMLLFGPPDLGAIVHLAEPHGGSFASAPVAAREANDELAVIADEVRVEARSPMSPPPSWWSMPGQAADPPRAPAARAMPTAARSRAPASSTAWSPVGAAPVAGLAAATVAVAARRRRRRAKTSRRVRRRSRE
ncbi:MAG TPA: M23 family metallopeptidase [Acidimicrobiia bacterium]|nr:M23 family metallopeptidase [Acidimicrobiia bacterium]